MSKLLDAASAGDHDYLSDTWLELLDGDPPFDEMGEVFAMLAASGGEELAAQLLELTIDEKELDGGAAFHSLLLRCAELFHECEPLRKALIELLRDEHLMFQPLEHFLKISGLRDTGADVSSCWKGFRSLMKYRDGGYLYHGTFGTGRILRVSRTHVTVDFPTAQNHDMKLDVALETTFPLDHSSLAVLSLEDRQKFLDLLSGQPGEFLRRLMEEPFVGGGGVAREDLNPLAAGFDGDGDELWKMLKRAASAAGGFADLGDRVVALDESVELIEQLRDIIGRRKTSVSDKVHQVQSLLKSCSGQVTGDLASLLPEVAGLKSPETGSLFELCWILTEGEGSEEPGSIPSKFIETNAARAERALSEIRSQSCRKAYVERFFSSRTDRDEKLSLLSSLRRSLWEHAVAFLEEHNPEFLSRSITGFLSRPSMTDLFLWSLAYLATRGDVLREASSEHETEEGPENGLELFLDNLIFASADTQKKVISLLMGPLREDLNEYLDSIDTRRLGRYLESFDTSATAHNEGLFLAVGREMSRRRSSGVRRTGGRHFWESDSIFSSRESIRRREQEVQKLKQVDIPAAAEAIGEAASHGDLSENAEYAAAMEKRDLLLDRLNRWTEELQAYRPYPSAEISAETVSPGIRVTLQDTGEAETVQVLDVVGPLDSDPDSGRINYMAPLGRVLLGMSQGDVVELPGGDEGEWRIVSLEVLPLVNE
ncbi:MAG: GreA/GreB family elongation factor [Candidatus Fermentibacteraceae bacterium]|nr:GreA/GreB family elongation factor [Candidatus Fermentibacteraceae bacterium]MBN2609235.1 GreA/GreB family elongation factor [Candidatus Fermentibacteraceae bacterium]